MDMSAKHHQQQEEEPRAVDDGNERSNTAPDQPGRAPAPDEQQEQQLDKNDSGSLDNAKAYTMTTSDFLQIKLTGDIENNNGHVHVDAAMSNFAQAKADTCNDFSEPLKHPHTCKIFEFFGIPTPEFFAPTGSTKKGARTNSQMVTDALDAGTCTGTGTASGGVGIGNGSDREAKSLHLHQGSWGFNVISGVYHLRTSINRQASKASEMSLSFDDLSEVQDDRTSIGVREETERIAVANPVLSEEEDLPAATLATSDASDHDNATWSACVVAMVVISVIAVATLVTMSLVGDGPSSSSDLNHPTLHEPKSLSGSPNQRPEEPTSLSRFPNTTNSTTPMDLLPLYTMMAINETGSPQAKAYQWWIRDPAFETYSNKRLIQRFALATLYFATNGEDWDNNTHWLSYTVPECEWYFSNDISFFPPKVGTLSSGVSFISEGDLISTIDLLAEGSSHESAKPTLSELVSNAKLPCFEFHNKTDGENDDEIMHMLLLHDNNLEGALPPEMYLLTELEIVFMFINEKLQGNTISPLIGNLSKLNILLMDSCGIEGEIPSELGMATKLRAITLSNNALNGTIPSELFKLTDLFAVNLEGNKLTGAVPSEIGLFSKNPLEVILDQNYLTSIPSEVGLLSNLTELVVSNNSLTTLPTEVWQMASSLGLFLINDNPLEMETVPAEVLASWCYIAGSIPTEIGRLNGLTEELICTSCGDCQVTGTLPTQLGLLRALTSLIVEGTGLDGPLPTELGLMTSLHKLSLMSNQFSGALPSELGLLTDLFSLNLASNSFTGPVPSELGYLSSLSWLSLASNQLAGPLPSEMDLLTGLHPLHLTNNSVNASMP